MSQKNIKWLGLARELFSMSQSGITYCKNEYDLHSYRRLQEMSAEIISAHSELSKESILKTFTAQNGYATPKIDVRGAVISDGKILLVQESADNKWALPGGWADIGDMPSQMVEREVLEESGFKVRTVKVIAVYDANRSEPMEFFHAYKIIFLCELLGGEMRISHETLAVKFFNFDDLPELSTARTDTHVLQEVFAHIQNPDRVTSFD